MANYRDLIESLIYCDDEKHAQRAVKLIRQSPRKVEELLGKGFCIKCRWFRQCNCSPCDYISAGRSTDYVLLCLGIELWGFRVLRYFFAFRVVRMLGFTELGV